MGILFWIIIGVLSSFFLAASITSFSEKEVRAGFVFLIIFAGFLACSLLLNFSTQNQNNVTISFIVFVFLIAILLFFPSDRISLPLQNRHGARFHEADAVLSRRLLKPDTAEYEKYYKEHPEYKLKDDGARENPGLLSENAVFYDPVTFGVSEANFTLTEHLHALENFPHNQDQKVVDKKLSSRFIKKWLLQTGAHSVGFTALEDHHLYSHKGRGKRSGEPISKEFPHAIAITVEMNYQMMKFAPAGPTVMESAEQYLHSGILATKLALFIKNSGYNAKAHIDGHYEVICPLVAADAGLGVIGRMGLLMTPGLGPRVRIAVVTTNLPLEYTKKRINNTPIDFCRKCKKCAAVCPSKAIPFGPAKEKHGSIRWKIDSEACYNYWTLTGTDCGRCVICCPYSHQDNWLHNFIRWGTKNNLLFRRMAVKFDNVFYGRNPKIRYLPDWLKLTR